MGGWIFRKVGQLPLKTFLKERGHLQAPKERQFIAWGLQPQDPETRKKKPFTAPAGRQARAVAELSCRPDWGSERGSARVAWGHPGAYASRL